MSSPIAKSNKQLLDRLLIKAHQATSHGHRVAVLGEEIIQALLRADPERGGRRELLDIGCGDMTLAGLIERQVPACRVTGLDLYELPADLAKQERWERYRRFDGQNIPFETLSFDAALMCDVLHHADESARRYLLSDALRVARIVIIKDHFEYGWLSRQALRAMDFVGNYGYGVSVPKRYFTRCGFEKLVDDAKGRIGELKVGLKLYEHLPGVRTLLRPQWHFIACLSRAM